MTLPAPMQMEIFITRRSAAAVVEEEEERVLDRMRVLRAGHDWEQNKEIPPAHVVLELTMLEECHRRLHEARSRIEALTK